MSVLEQKVDGGETFWNGKTETANRVRGRIEAILDWAQVQGMRKGKNVARWRGFLDKSGLTKRLAPDACVALGTADARVLIDLDHIPPAPVRDRPQAFELVGDRLVIGADG